MATANQENRANHTLEAIRSEADLSSQSRPTEHCFEKPAIITKLSHIAIQGCRLSDVFSQVERVPRGSNGERENDVEHSFMLAVVAPNLARIVRPELDENTIRLYSLVHDMLEIETGDVATFSTSQQELAEKARLEQAAMKALLPKLPPIEAEALIAYEKQADAESRFVRMVDKILPVGLDIVGQGVRVVEEDYGISSLRSLEASHDKLVAKVDAMFGEEFPELVDTYISLAYVFEQQYAKESQTRITRTPDRPHHLKEIERKWTVLPEHLPNLSQYGYSTIRQGYLGIGSDGSETRIRSFDDERFELTTKSPGTIERSEQNIKIDRPLFEALWPQTGSLRIEKTRYYIPYTDNLGREYVIELDVYGGDLEGKLITAEIEFPGREADARVQAAAFQAPDWFRNDVTGDPRYKNHALASMQHGFLTLGS
ncbi:MAG: HD domain-containing protein [Candidatus Saccharibacteria bacterium]|nr:HD domain-containing protein [Candidatus Saccharibacteria bacterium]